MVTEWFFVSCGDAGTLNGGGWGCERAVFDVRVCKQVKVEVRAFTIKSLQIDVVMEFC